jgi:hypothetical protein
MLAGAQAINAKHHSQIISQSEDIHLTALPACFPLEANDGGSMDEWQMMFARLKWMTQIGSWYACTCDPWCR